MTTMLHRFVPTQLEQVGELEFGGNAGSGDVQDDGYALDLRGGDLSRLQSGNAPLLWSHNTDAVIGRVLSIRVANNALPFKATFPPEGANELADQKRKLLKGGVLRGVSLGFTIDAWEPISPSRPSAGRRATKWTGLELSLCAIPVDAKAVVTERAMRRNMNAITKALIAATTAQDEHRAGSRHHVAIQQALHRAEEKHRDAGNHLRRMKRALEEGNHDEAQDSYERCQQCIRAAERESRAILDVHGDALESYGAVARAMREAWSALGADSGPVTSKGGLKDTEPDLDDVPKGRRRRKRNLDLLRLKAVALGIE
jgi:HK97 family phage prohead protease